MKITLQLDYQQYTVDLSKPLRISFPLVPNVKNVNCYYAESPKSEIICVGDFIGNVAQGGSVNYQKLTLTPHGNGTHTECYGHISSDKMTLNDALAAFHFVAQVISVTPQNLPNGDALITLESIQKQFGNLPYNALILRTLPNSNKKLKQYSGTNPPYLSPEIGVFLREKNIAHLLVDLPSVDKESDEGALQMHKSFWNYPKKPQKNATITELIYVSDDILDGNYLLNLQVLNIEMDASPSNPVLFRME